jgi:hypothetical protein
MQVQQLPAHLTEFTLGEIDRSTARLEETSEQRTRRLAAIRAMYDAYAPKDGIEDMFVGQIISMRFLVADAMRRLASMAPDTEDAETARKSAGGLNRILLSWVRQFELRRARDAKQQAATANQQPGPERDRPVGTLRLPVTAASAPGVTTGANGAARPPAQPSPSGAGASATPVQPAGGGVTRPQPQQTNGAVGSVPAGNSIRPAGTPPNGAGPRAHTAS